MLRGRRRSQGVLVALLMVLLTAVTALTARSAPAVAGSTTWPDEITDTFVVYMATPETGGSDSNSGLALTEPVTTLSRVQDVLVRNRPETDVEIRIGPGTYDQPPMDSWRFYVPGHTVSFMPYDYAEGEGEDGITERPVFRNSKCSKTNYCDGAWLTARPPTDPADPFYRGGDSGLRFFYLTIERYSAAAISIRGDSERDVENEKYDPPLRDKGVRLDHNVFVGLNVREIGNRWSKGHYGWGAIVLTDSSDNRIENNTFTNIENSGDRAGYIHGVYITHFSNDNMVNNNRFTTVSGDPIKVRNRSNDNVIERNEFEKAGQASYYRDEFCGKACAIDNDKAQECPSYGNRFARNILRGGYDKAKIELFTYSSSSYPNTTASACGKLTVPQLRTELNVTKE